MNADHIGTLADHSPRKIGGGTESLLIHKVAPSSYSLSDQETHHCDVENRQKLHFLDFGNRKTACKRTDYSAVDCETSVVYVENLYRIFTVVIPLEKAEVQPCSDYACYNSYEYAIYKLVEINVVSRGTSPSIQYCKQKSRGYYDSVPVDRIRSERKCYGIYCEIKSESRKADVIFHIKPPFRTALQPTECSCRHRAFQKVAFQYLQSKRLKQRQYTRKARCR